MITTNAGTHNNVDPGSSQNVNYDTHSMFNLYLNLSQNSSTIDFDNSLHLQSSDSPGMKLVSEVWNWF